MWDFFILQNFAEYEPREIRQDRRQVDDQSSFVAQNEQFSQERHAEGDDFDQRLTELQSTVESNPVSLLRSTLPTEDLITKLSELQVTEEPNSGSAPLPLSTDDQTELSGTICKLITEYSSRIQFLFWDLFKIIFDFSRKYQYRHRRHRGSCCRIGHSRRCRSVVDPSHTDEDSNQNSFQHFSHEKDPTKPGKFSLSQAYSFKLKQVCYHHDTFQCLQLQ